MTVTKGATGDYVVEDRGAPVTAGEGCVAESATRVHCRGPMGAEPPGVIAFLGDGDDSARYETGDSIVFGQAGDDVLIGSDAHDIMFGGEGNDRLSGRGGADSLEGDDMGFLSGASGDDDVLGGPGNDNLAGGPGADLVSGGDGNDALDGDFTRFLFGSGRTPPRGRDRLRGGAGVDVVQYQFTVPGRTVVRPAPALRVTFDGRSNDGPRGEGDDIARDVERAYSLTSAQVIRSSHGFTVRRLRGPNGRPLAGRLGVRIYRLGRRGSRRARTALLEGTEFTERDRRSSRASSEIVLRGGRFDRCRAGSGARASRGRGGGIIRKLLARVRGLFRVNARYVSLTVHGTAFSVVERCRQTVVRVTEGKVEARVPRRRGVPGPAPGPAPAGRTLLRRGDTLRIMAPAPR